MKHLPASVDLSKLDIRHTHGVSPAFLAAAEIEANTPIAASISQLRDAMPAKPKRPRYGRARRVELDGYIFDSQGESKRYVRLKYEQIAGEIADLKIHPEFDMAVNGELVYTYTADFLYIRGGLVVCEDYKSEGTRRKDTWRLIQKLFHALYGYRITEVGKDDA